MSISLQKGQTISISKNQQLSRIAMGLGWDMAKPEKAKTGFLSSLFGSSEPEDIDLDASCVMLDASGAQTDAVWFRKLKSSCGSVVHTGDNLTGDGDGDDETINIELSRIPPQVVKLVFLVNSFRGQTFDSVSNAFCRIVNLDDGRELAKYDLSSQGSHTGQIMAALVRSEDGWSFKAIGEPSQGQTFADMLPLIKRVAND